MKTYLINAVDGQGKKMKLVEKAISLSLLEESITSKGYYIIDIKEHNYQNNQFFTTKLKKKFLLDFSFNVYSLLDFGLDINEIIRILSDIFTTGLAAEFISAVSESLKKGEKLSTAIKNADTGEAFDDFIITMISSGEVSGKLTESFHLIYSYLKSNEKVKEKIVSTIIYPAFLVVIAFGAINMLFFFILPNIKNVYTNLDFQPSTFVQVMINISNFLKQFVLLYLLFIVFFILANVIFFRAKPLRNIRYMIMSKLPIISNIFKLQKKIKISFSIGILLKGGSTLEEALIRLTEIEKDELIKKEFSKCLLTLKSGDGVKKTFAGLKVFDVRDLNIIEISDSISRSVEGFEKIYQDNESALELYLMRLMTIIEPVIIIFIAFFIFLLMFLVVSPTLEMLKNF